MKCDSSLCTNLLITPRTSVSFDVSKAVGGAAVYSNGKGKRTIRSSRSCVIIQFASRK